MGKYQNIIKSVFFKYYKKGDTRVKFKRDDLSEACTNLGFKVIKNLGDIPYSFRFRTDLPEEISEIAPKNSEWIISGTGIAEYEFRLASPGKISPSSYRLNVSIPDSTPEILKIYAPGTDEQALLTRVRYNRLIGTFLGITCYSIQNHLRTTVKGIGQIEVDEIYIGINKRGVHFVVPCQAKSPGDKFGIVQVMQDMALCKEKYPNTICRPIALQFTGKNELSILELTVIEENDTLKLQIVDEKHYALKSKSEINDDELKKLKDME